jgi:hypothetical protein
MQTSDGPAGPRARMLKETVAKLETETGYAGGIVAEPVSLTNTTSQAGSPVYTSPHNLSMDFTVVPKLTNNLTTVLTQYKVHPMQAPLASEDHLPSGLRNVGCLRESWRYEAHFNNRC